MYVSLSTKYHESHDHGAYGTYTNRLPEREFNEYVVNN